MNTTSISWTEKTWNPVSGCSPASEGCANCYAKRMAQRLRGRFGYPADEPFRVTLHPERLEEPLRLRKPSRIFVCSMSDLFHEDVPFEFVDQVFDVMATARKHTFMVLTKRPRRLLEYARSRTRETGEGYLNEGNVWLGVTAENQARADERIPILLETPAAVRFVSIEPMLGPVNLNNIKYRPGDEGWLSAFNEGAWPELGHVDWVIAGGETGPNARPMHPDWARSLRDQCQAVGVPFHFKSWGAYREACAPDDPIWNGQSPNLKHEHGTHFIKLNPRETGRLLDGREWNEYPEVTTND